MSEPEQIPDDPAATIWDVVVVGTGMGGATAGYALARAGHRVLFLEKGRFLHREAGLKVEPSGAATTAALLSGKVRPRGATVVVVSGGNVDEELFDRLMSAE